MYREGSSERIGNYGEVPVERYWGLPGFPRISVRRSDRNLRVSGLGFSF